MGSTSFDIRSIRLNDEASLNVCDRALAREVTEVFEADPYTHEQWRGRPLREKLAEKVVVPIKSQL